MEIIKKAYSIDFTKIRCGFLYSDVVCYADNRNKARTILLNEIRYDDLVLMHTCEDISYINIPVKRSMENDIVIFEDLKVRRNEIERIKIERQRELEYEKILNAVNVEYCYIRKNGYYYRSDYSGYTEYKHQAGIYDKHSAYKHVGRSIELQMIPIDIVEHNKMVSEKIKELEEHLIR